MRKQTDFVIRVIQLSNNPEAYGGMTAEQARQFIKDAYLSQGWEVMSAEHTQVEGNSVFFAVALVKWEDISEEPKAKK